MEHQSSFPQWYEPPQDLLSSSKLSIVEAAFEDAKAEFEHDSANDTHVLELTRSKTSIDQVHVAVQNAQDVYDNDRRYSKARKWLDRLSQRLHFYGGVLDVIAQHHPEYVALAWGSIKFLLVAAINHEKIVRTLAKAITLFAEALPRVGLQSSLYPTHQMKEAVTKLYVSIFQFLARARQWYQGNGLQRLYHSIVHPVELRYNDLLNEVAECSRTIDLLSYCGAQAETRDMHRTVQAIQAENRDTQRTVQTLLNVVERINATTSLTSATCLNTNNVVTDIQLNQIMDTLLVVSMLDPMKSFQYHCALRRQRSRSVAMQSIPIKFWQSPKLRKWSSTQESALTIISGNYQARYVVRDFCVDVIKQLNDAAVLVLLALKAPQEDNISTLVSTIDVLKYLWFQILKAVLADLGQLVYIVVDLELLDRHIESRDGIIWVQQFQSMFADFTRRRSRTKVKIVQTCSCRRGHRWLQHVSVKQGGCNNYRKCLFG
ncbi:hypothetical protein DE146DRAFT_228650 [Phaeosphaeria sp. MPI-PUGE-AT-0046c]|nr:hypothetical protein DE146DRAFT_228650 [Phaeosphaeria sp. MPI-PUGE-AT-0046c]